MWAALAILSLLAGGPDAGVSPPPPSVADTMGYHLAGPIIDTDAPSVMMFFSTVLVTGHHKALIEIDSPGGDTETAWVIVKTIEAAVAEGVDVTCRVDGKAASAAFMILQACPHREMTTRSRLMTHEPIATFSISATDDAAWENARTRSTAEAAAWATFCVHRLKTTREDYDRRVRAGRQWWFQTPADALKWGAVDRVVR